MSESLFVPFRIGPSFLLYHQGINVPSNLQDSIFCAYLFYKELIEFRKDLDLFSMVCGL